MTEENAVRYEIRPDGNCWALVKVRKQGEKAKVPGKEVENAFSWHRDLKDAVRRLMELSAIAHAEYRPLADAIELAKQDVLSALETAK